MCERMTEMTAGVAISAEGSNERSPFVYLYY